MPSKRRWHSVVASPRLIQQVTYRQASDRIALSGIVESVDLFPKVDAQVKQLRLASQPPAGTIVLLRHRGGEVRNRVP